MGDTTTTAIDPATDLILAAAIADSKVTPGEPGQPRYPHVETHTWGAFAGMAIELDGYSDATVIDPYTGDRLWCGRVLDPAEGQVQVTVPDALRRIAAVMEANPQFMPTPVDFEI